MNLALCASVGSLSAMQGQEQNFFNLAKNDLKRLIQDTKNGSTKAEDFKKGFEVFQTFAQNPGFKGAIEELNKDVVKAIEENSSESLSHMGKTEGYFDQGVSGILASLLGSGFLFVLVRDLARYAGEATWRAADYGTQAAIATVCIGIAYGIKKCGWDAQIISRLRARNEELKKIAEILKGGPEQAVAKPEASEGSGHFVPAPAGWYK
jgi:hypothetical protein